MPLAIETISQELLPLAHLAVQHFRDSGYAVAIDVNSLGYPATATLRCKRAHTTLILEFTVQYDESKIRDWVSYAKSTSSDTRIAICISATCLPMIGKSAQLRDLGVGLFVEDGGVLSTVIDPKDLAINFALPDLKKCPLSVRKLLGNAYEKFAKHYWRECFEDACQIFEAEARRYFKEGSKRGRIRVARKNGPVVLTPQQIEKLTMGQLGVNFSQIINQNLADSLIAKALKSLNKDRVAAAHHKTKASTEKRLRQNVGKHMWTIVQALKEIA